MVNIDSKNKPNIAFPIIKQLIHLSVQLSVVHEVHKYNLNIYDIKETEKIT